VALSAGGEETLTFDSCIIATGAQTRLLPGTALSGRVVTYEEQIMTPELPGSVIIAGAVIALRRPVGAGSATVLGFRLQYHPVGGSDQFVLAAGIVEDACGPRVATAEAPGAVALELAGQAGGLLCVVNPVERHLATRVRYTIPGTSEQVSIPVCLPAVEIDGRGARLLPIGIDLGGGRRLRHATAELIERTATDDGSLRLSFAMAPGGRFEVAIDGPPATVVVPGGRAARIDEEVVARPWREGSATRTSRWCASDRPSLMSSETACSCATPAGASSRASARSTTRSLRRSTSPRPAGFTTASPVRPKS